MIKFFRRIRHKLVSEKNLGKYLLYAAGEIVLVVIGILIALQINNANEARKSRLLEVTILENIKGDIALDTLDMNFNIEYHERFLKAEYQLLAFLQSDLPQPIDSINYSDALSIPILTILHKSTFRNLQNNDINLISNNNLHKEISRFYDFFVNALELIENETEIYETYNAKKEYFKKYFKLSESNYKSFNDGYTNANYYNPDFEKTAMEFSNIPEAKNDEGFKIELNESILIRQVLLGFYYDMLARIKELNLTIDKELQILK